MPAYFIVDIDVTDPTAFEEYRKTVPASQVLGRHGIDIPSGRP